MDEILAKASNQAVTFAIRSGISLASGYAIKAVSKFLDRIPESEKNRLMAKRHKIQLKINIISTSIELIRLVGAQGNTSLESTNVMIDELNEEFEQFDNTIEIIINKLSNNNEGDMIKKVEKYMNLLIEKIDESVSLINLAIVTNGISVTRDLPKHISISRLIESSNILITANTSPKESVIGPVFDLKYYTVFYNPSRLKYIEEAQENSVDLINWKEEFARCKVNLKKIDQFDYSIEITENFDDGRFHDDEKPKVKTIPIGSVEKLFFSASGKLLKLENANSPVLILKLGTEYIAFGEVDPKDFLDDDDDDDNDEDEDNDNNNDDKVKSSNKDKVASPEYVNKLSLLEYLIRLSILQHTDQKSVADIKDERLGMYLNNEIPTLINLQNIDDNLDLNSNINRLENLTLNK